MTWGQSWGSAWGSAFGVPHVITGTGAADQIAAQSFGIASIPGAIVARVAPDNHPGGVPSSQFLRDSALRHGFILSGDGSAEQDAATTYGQGVIPKTVSIATGSAHQAPGQTNGSGRIRRAILTATCAMADSSSGFAGQSKAEFIDSELEQFAITAAIAANEWRRTA